MTEGFRDPLSSVVIDRHEESHVSPTSHHKTSDNKPPNPRKRGDGQGLDSDDLLKRAERARRGSRRRRDLEALRIVERMPAPSDVAADPTADLVFQSARLDVAEHLDDAAVFHWLDPLVCIGSLDNAICIEGPPRVTDWCRRRYGAALRAAIERNSSYRGLNIYDGEPS